MLVGSVYDKKIHTTKALNAVHLSRANESATSYMLIFNSSFTSTNGTCNLSTHFHSIMASATDSPEKLKVSNPNSWDTAAAQYNNAVGRSSQLGAIHLISLTETLELPLSAPGARAIDLGAGTGSLTYQLAARYPELPILATDVSPSMLDQLMVNATANITTQVADMRAPVVGAAAEASFSHVFSTMAIQLLPDPAADGTLAEWARLWHRGDWSLGF